MRLARLDLYGFKSFPDRTTFHFGPGISCVVGPNGSGKSNVVDALKWCIGEQSARSLRGAEMTDVIFAGSSDRKPVGFAEVVLTLVTDDAQPFAGDYATFREVQVGRRLHRSGTSEYLLNQSKVRRRDVVELLLDSGIGNDLYSFIEQGQVDKMISASPEDRRSLIDEAAGISRYKARRDEARESLEATAAQLDRAADVVDEMGRHLRALEGQVLKAAESRRLAALVRLGELRVALAKHLALSADRSALRDQIGALRAEEEAGRRDVVKREEELVRQREEIAGVEEGLVQQREQLALLDGEIREQSATAQLQERREQELLSERARATAEVALQEGRAAQGLAEAAAASREQAELDGRLVELDAQIAGTANEATDADEAVRAAREGLNTLEKRVQDALAERIQVEGRLHELRRATSERELRIASLETDLAERRAALVQAGHARDRSEDDRRTAEGELAAAAAVVTALDEDLREVRSVEVGVRSVLREAEEARDRALAAREKRRTERTRSIDRGRSWLSAIEQAASREQKAAERTWNGRIAEVEQRGRAAVTASRTAAEDARTRSLAEIEQAAVARRKDVELAIGAATREVAASRAGADAADADHLRQVRVLASIEAELAVARRQLTASGDADTLLRRVLPEVRTLAELAPAAERAEWVRRLGDRARQVVVREAGALARLAQERPPETTLSVVYWPEGTPSPAEGVALADGLLPALGVDWPVAGDGFRIEPGGFVTLGPPGELERAIAAERALDERAVTVRAEIGRIEQRRAEAKAALAAAEKAHQEHVERRERAVREGAEVMEGARTSGSAAVATAERTAREAAESELAASRAEREQVLESLQRRHTAELEHARAALVAWEAQEAARPEEVVADEVPAAREAVRLAAEATEAVRRRREQAVEQRVVRERARDAAAARTTAAIQEVARLEKRIGEGLAEHAAATAERASASDLGALDGAVSAAAAREAAVRAELEAGRTAVARSEAVERACREGIGRLRVERASVVERIASARDRATVARGRSVEATQAAERAGAHAHALATQAAGAAAARAAALAAEAEAREERGEVWDQLEVERQRSGRLVESRDTAEKTLRQIRSKVDQLGHRVEKLGSQHAGFSSDLEVLRGRIEDRYQVSLAVVLDELRVRGAILLDVDPDVQNGLTVAGRTVEGVAPITLVAADLDDEDVVRAAVTDLDTNRQALSVLGEVNLAAPQEYRELTVRHDELAAQRTDLESSVDGIRAAIAKLNRMCRERFRETFDRVNEYFQEVYPRLVGGGSARLSLTNEEDLLETGVEIFVQPPGKRLQNLQLLSGGEKAMTAIALLISLFRVKPSPFCVLDEVDAPLDEANGARFNEMLKEMAARSQFLVITHNRKTMECADTLYGITMARPGVSRLVSVDMEAW